MSGHTYRAQLASAATSVAVSCRLRATCGYFCTATAPRTTSVLVRALLVGVSMSLVGKFRKPGCRGANLCLSREMGCELMTA